MKRTRKSRNRKQVFFMPKIKCFWSKWTEEMDYQGLNKIFRSCIKEAMK